MLVAATRSKGAAAARTVWLRLASLVLCFGLAIAGPVVANTTDHTKLKELKGPFKSGQEVTQVCLACHNRAGHQVMKSLHWTWETKSPTTGKTLGKRFAANNFCGSPLSNEPRCTSCHAGYGWQDKNFDFTNQDNVDCLACHDTTGTYKKFIDPARINFYEA